MHIHILQACILKYVSTCRSCIVLYEYEFLKKEQDINGGEFEEKRRRRQRKQKLGRKASSSAAPSPENLAELKSTELPPFSSVFWHQVKLRRQVGFVNSRHRRPLTVDTTPMVIRWTCAARKRDHVPGVI